MDRALLIVLAAVGVTRLLTLRRFWLLPKRRGGAWLFASELTDPELADRARAILSRYRARLVAPFALDAALVTALVATDRAALALYEQVAAVVVVAVVYNLLVAHYTYAAKALVPEAATEQPVSAVRVAIEQRRLRDRSNWTMEIAIAALSITGLVLWAVMRFASVLMVAWLVYLQLGLVLLKQVFVRWRLRVPIRRADDYLRWREAWLAYHLHVFDAARIVVALVLVSMAAATLAEERLSEGRSSFAMLGAWIGVGVVYTAYCIRERRRLAVVERDVRPTELVREFPPSPIVEGVGSGVFFYDRNTPVGIARGEAGIGINLAHRAPYVWTAYVVGLVVLAVLALG